MRADRREELRRMEQFKDQILRLESDRKEREAQIEALEAGLTAERTDSDQRIQEALAKSELAIQQITRNMGNTRPGHPTSG